MSRRVEFLLVLPSELSETVSRENADRVEEVRVTMNMQWFWRCGTPGIIPSLPLFTLSLEPNLELTSSKRRPKAQNSQILGRHLPALSRFENREFFPHPRPSFLLDEVLDDARLNLQATPIRHLVGSAVCAKASSSTLHRSSNRCLKSSLSSPCTQSTAQNTRWSDAHDTTT
jgi:hypothetical protein